MALIWATIKPELIMEIKKMAICEGVPFHDLIDKLVVEAMDARRENKAAAQLSTTAHYVTK